MPPRDKRKWTRESPARSMLWVKKPKSSLSNLSSKTLLSYTPGAKQIKLNLAKIQIKRNKLSSSQNFLKTLSSLMSCSKTLELTLTTSSPKRWCPWLKARLPLQRRTSQSLPLFLKISVSKRWKNRNRRRLSTLIWNNFPQKLLKMLITNKSWLNSWPLRNQTAPHSSSRSSKAWLIWPEEIRWWKTKLSNIASSNLPWEWTKINRPNSSNF